MSFKELGLRAEIRSAVESAGYTTPTPIQQEAIPYVLEGRDIMAGAQTGTGKTAGFTLPILHRLSQNKVNGRPVRALVLVPTRELAAQVAENVLTYSKNLDLKTAVVFGGVNIRPQISQLKSGVDILIATPGRLLDHLGQGNLRLDQVETLVLDEADRMLDMGFLPDIKRVLKLVPNDRQTLLFSATFSKEIKQLANTFLNNPAEVQIAQQNTTAERIVQLVQLVDQKRKRELLSFMVGSNNWTQVLVFTRTKHGANRLATQLDKDGIKSAAIHGNKSQGARTKALKEFKEGKLRVLVATDIAARGLDISQLPHVVNFELPNKPEDYVHRIGRTGRAGREGQAISFVCREETKQLRDIEKLLQCELPQAITEGYEPTEPALSNLKSDGRSLRKPSGGGSSQNRTRKPSNNNVWGKKSQGGNDRGGNSQGGNSNGQGGNGQGGSSRRRRRPSGNRPQAASS